MSETPSMGTHDPESDDAGIISGTIPAATALINPIFGGCCCVSNCSEQEREVEEGKQTMDGGKCCPNKNPPKAGTPPAEGEEPPPQEPPEYGGTCDVIKMQLSLFGGPYLNLALAFEPILDVPPGPPKLDFLVPGIPLFGPPDLKLPAIPIPPLDASLPGVPMPGFFLPSVSIPPALPPLSFPGFGLLQINLLPINLGLKLINLEPPEIPSIDCPSLLVFSGLKPNSDEAEARCGIPPDLPPAEFNLVVCAICMLCFFLLIVLPLLIILIGMKNKGIFDEITDEEGNINWNTIEEDGTVVSNFTPEMMPPPVNIIHSAMDAGEADGEKHNQFFRRENREGYSGNVVLLEFQASIHYVKDKFNIDFPLFGDDVPSEPNVERDNVAGQGSGGYVTFPGNWHIKWEIFGPPGDREDPPIGSEGPSQELLNFMTGNTIDAEGNPLDPTHEDYIPPDFNKFMNGDAQNNVTGFKSIFDNFKNSISPNTLENMEDRMVSSTSTQDQHGDDQGEKTFRPWRAARPRVRYTFDRDGFYEVYCTVEKKNDDNVETATFMTTVLIGPKPEMPTELPPILNIMRAPPVSNPVVVSDEPVRPDPPVPPAPESQPEPQPDPPAAPEERIKI